MTTAMATAYAEKVARGDIDRDGAQEMLAARFDHLLAELAGSGGSRGFLSGLFGRRSAPAPRGVYVWGEVGRGKSMLMDMFFERAPLERKRRVHFHAFMVDVHARVHAQRSAGGGEDPILAVADGLAEEVRLLCFDEMQVKDIADAMMLARLFGRLFERGVVVVATSNAPPDRLYLNGLNRQLFLPFIAMVQERMDVVRLDARTDFRQKKEAGGRRWHVPADARARAALDEAFRRLSRGAEPRPETLRVQGRDVVVPRAAGDVGRFGFEDLCATARGPADYGAIAARYRSLVLDDVPLLDTRPDDVVRRFVILVDELYDRGVHLVASAAAEPDRLLTGGRQAWEFQRTASRLQEMRSAAWPPQDAGRDTAGDGGAPFLNPS